MVTSGNIITASLLAILLVAAGAVSAQDSDLRLAQSTQRTPDAVDRKVEPRMRSMACVSHLEVTDEGAHLREGQVLLMVGPILDNSYLVLPVHPGSVDIESLKWDSKPLIAIDTGLGNGIYVLSDVTVTEPGGEHPHATDHPMVLQITESDDGCPTEIDIHGFQHTGTLGLHGGRAHASGG